MTLPLPKRIGGTSADEVKDWEELNKRLSDIERNFREIQKQFPVSTQSQSQVPQAKIYLASAANHTSSSSFQKVPADTVAFDFGTDVAQASTSLDTLTCRVPGLYSIVACNQLGASAGNYATQIVLGASTVIAYAQPNSSGLSFPSAPAMTFHRLAVGDAVQQQALQTSGGNLAYTTGVGTTYLAWCWVSP